MRVLLVSRSAPFPLSSGRAQRTRAIVRALAQHHDVTLACPLDRASRSAAELALAPDVKHFVWADPELTRGREFPTSGSRMRRFAEYFADFFRHTSPLEFRTTSTAWREQLEPIVRDFDAVVCRYANVFPLVAGVSPRRVVVDIDDLTFVSYWQAAWSGEQGLGAILCLFEAWRSLVTEQRIALRCARTLVVSSRDRRRLIGRRKTVMPNGVTLETSLMPAVAIVPGRLVFVADWRWDPNALGLEWFVREVWPAIHASHPTATLAVVGRSANAGTLPFAVRPGIELADNVVSVRPWFESAVVSVVPLFQGVGTRIKIVESLGIGTPVVATPVGAAGLTDEFGPDLGLVIARNSAEMIFAVRDALDNPLRLRSAAAAGRAIVQARYTWDVTTTSLANGLQDWIR